MEAKIMIFEDEPFIAEEIKVHLLNAGYKEVITSSSLPDALRRIQMDFPDIAILDINTPEDRQAGIKLAEKINEKQVIPIIYLTGYAEDFVLRNKAFSTRPAAFLSKPFDQSTLLAQIDLAVHKLNTPGQDHETDAATASDINLHFLDDSIFVKKGRTQHRVPLRDIIYAKAEGSYTDIHTRAEKYTLSATLSIFESQAKADYLIRIHRTYLANFLFISEFNQEGVTIDGIPLPITKDVYEQLNEKLKIITSRGRDGRK